MANRSIQSIIYKHLTGLPGKVLGHTSALMGIAQVFIPQEKLQSFLEGRTMTAENIHFWGDICLIAGIVYFFLLWVLKPGRDSEDGGNNTKGDGAPITEGDNNSVSSMIVHGALNVHIGGVSAAINQPISPIVDLTGNMNGMENIMSKKKDAPSVGDESVVIGNVASNVGNKSVVIGSTDNRGNVLLNQGMSIGYQAGFSASGVIIGAYAGLNHGRKSEDDGEN